MKLHTLFLLLVCALMCACNKPSGDQIKVDEDGTVVVPVEIFWNPDSIDYYGELAFLEDDPKGCFIMGACYYLRQQGQLPLQIHTVSHEEADGFLMISAGKGYKPAKDLIKCLQKNNCWNH